MRSRDAASPPFAFPSRWRRSSPSSSEALAARLHANDYHDGLAFWDATRHACPRSAKAHLNYSVFKAPGETWRFASRRTGCARPGAGLADGEHLPRDKLCHLHRATEAWPYDAHGFELAATDSKPIALGLPCLWEEKALVEDDSARPRGALGPGREARRVLARVPRERRPPARRRVPRGRPEVARQRGYEQKGQSRSRRGGDDAIRSPATSRLRWGGGALRAPLGITFGQLWAQTKVWRNLLVSLARRSCSGNLKASRAQVRAQGGCGRAAQDLAAGCGPGRSRCRTARRASATSRFRTRASRPRARRTPRRTRDAQEQNAGGPVMTSPKFVIITFAGDTLAPDINDFRRRRWRPAAITGAAPRPPSIVASVLDVSDCDRDPGDEPPGLRRPGVAHVEKQRAGRGDATSTPWPQPDGKTTLLHDLLPFDRGGLNQGHACSCDGFLRLPRRTYANQGEQLRDLQR